jgi:hypothetical protein
MHRHTAHTLRRGDPVLVGTCKDRRIEAKTLSEIFNRHVLPGPVMPLLVAQGAGIQGLHHNQPLMFKVAEREGLFATAPTRPVVLRRRCAPARRTPLFDVSGSNPVPTSGVLERSTCSRREVNLAEREGFEPSKGF